MIYGRYFLIAGVLTAHAMWAQIVRPLTPPPAAISGKVMDQDGDPVDKASIGLVHSWWKGGKLYWFANRFAVTNDLGQYRIGNLVPGTYYVYIFKPDSGNGSGIIAGPGKPDIRPIDTFYPQAADLESATPVTVVAGQDLTGINVIMRSRPTYHIRGKVADHLTAVPGRGYALIAYGADQQNRFRITSGVATMRRDQTFDIAGISPGSYIVQLFSGGIIGLGQEDVTVADADVNNIEMHFMPLASIRGQVVIEGTPPARQPPASATNGKVTLSEGEFSVAKTCDGNADIEEDDTFSIDNVTPGRCNLYASSLPRTYLKSVRFDDKEVLGEFVDITPGAHRMILTFSYNGAQIDGKVLNLPSGHALGTVVLESEALTDVSTGAPLSLYQTSGYFRFAQYLAPGRYRLYAFDRLNIELSNLFANPAFRKQIESKGIEVELNEKDQKHIQLPLITDNELQQVLAGLPVDAPQD